MVNRTHMKRLAATIATGAAACALVVYLGVDDALLSENSVVRMLSEAWNRELPTPHEVSWPPFDYKGRLKRAGGCIRYTCLRYKDKDFKDHCSDDYAETDYAGDHPPCCTHVLRDMLRSVDDSFGALGLEYFAGYGSLLGLVRNDHVIPWTADNDFVLSFAVAEEVWKHRAYLNEYYGLNFFNDFYLRACASETFMGGALLKWKTTKYDKILAKSGKYVDYLPYADFFYGEVDPENGKFIDERGCGYEEEEYRPMKRLSVYNGTFEVSVPNDYVSVVESVFGPDWKKPDGGGKAHGYSKCGNKEFIRKYKKNTATDKEWDEHWNKLLQMDDLHLESEPHQAEAAAKAS